jgi:hypothetical protein
LKQQTSTLFKFRGAGAASVGSNSSQLGVAPSINFISTLAQKIGPIDEIKEAEAKGEVSVRKSAKKRENLHLNANLSSNNMDTSEDGEWNYVPSIRKVSLRESPTRRVNKHL